MMVHSPKFLDNDYPEAERLPRRFNVIFDQYESGMNTNVRILVDGKQIGDSITDNSRRDDAYRFHDIFHFSYVAVLGWSPCVRNMMRRKRKSNPTVDEVEDGARAIITEEAISLLVFNYAKQGKLLTGEDKINPIVLETIETLVNDFEVKARSLDEWKTALTMGYDVFRMLVKYRKGEVVVDMVNRQLSYLEH